MHILLSAGSAPHITKAPHARRIGIVAEMPTGPKGQKRPADVIGNAVRVMRIATGEEADDIVDDGKDPAAKALRRTLKRFKRSASGFGRRRFVTPNYAC